MLEFHSSKTALLIIDVQNFYWSDTERHEEFVSKLNQVIELCRMKGVNVIHVKHVKGENIEDTAFNIREEIKLLPGEPIIVKRTPGSFYNTNLDEVLKEKGIENILITGMKTNHCCDTTTREAAARGYKTTVINECVRTFDIIGIDDKRIPREAIQYVTLSILQGFAKIISYADFMNSKFL